MKVLTLHQPWASLVALGVKTIETRSRPTKYRGPLAIHAAARKPDVEMMEDGLAGDEEWGQWFETAAEDYFPPAPPPEMRWSIALAPAYDVVTMPLGAIVATCTLVDVVPMITPGEDCDYPCVEVRWDSLTLWWPPDYYGEGNEQNIEDQRPYGDFSPGRYAYLLADVVPVDPPVPFKGGQGLTKTWEPA